MEWPTVSPPLAATLIVPGHPSFTVDEVKLKRLRPGKAAGLNGVCSRLLKDCAAQLVELLQWLFSISLRLDMVPLQWKTSCLVPVPKVG